MASRSILTAGDSPSAHRQSKPIPAKRSASRIPAPQSIRIMKRYAEGASIRKISREEGRDRAAVTKVVKSEDMQALVRELREQLYGMAGQALQTVLEGMTERKNDLLAYKLLADLGVIPSPEERLQLLATPAVNDPNQGFKDQMTKAAEIMVERMKIYGTPFDELGVRMNRETGELYEIPPK